VTIRINRALDEVGARDVRRIFRSEIGDWCAEVAVYEQLHVAVFDHHPTVAMMRALRDAGTDIADEEIAQGAEGIEVRL
jgi:hypothetical protein